MRCDGSGERIGLNEYLSGGITHVLEIPRIYRKDVELSEKTK